MRDSAPQARDELSRAQSAGSGPPGRHRQSSSVPLYPFEFRQLGLSAGRVTFYVESPDLQDGWFHAMSDALGRRAQAHVPAFRILAFPAFGDDITATLPLRVSDRELLLIGGRRGVYVAWSDRLCSLRRVLHLAGVTRLARWPGPEAFLLVLADGVLLAYPLDSVLPPGSASILSGAEHGASLSALSDLSALMTGTDKAAESSSSKAQWPCRGGLFLCGSSRRGFCGDLCVRSEVTRFSC